jgi:hypothetical protein
LQIEEEVLQLEEGVLQIEERVLQIEEGAYRHIQTHVDTCMHIQTQRPVKCKYSSSADTHTMQTHTQTRWV